MKYFFNKILNFYVLLDLLPKVFLIIGVISLYVFSFLISMASEEGNTQLVYKLIIIAISINLPTLISFIILKAIESAGLRSNKGNMIIIMFNFLDYFQLSDSVIIEKTKTFFPKIAYKKVEKFFIQYKKKNITYYGPCKSLSQKEPKIRYFVIYSLFEIAAEDDVYSLEEEDLIEEISRFLQIPKRSYLQIKQAFNNQGLKDEKKILEEKKRKKSAELFLPYNAYKILGITPDVTKEQLKKVYRKLAKKYHPDKYYGQSEEVVQKAKDQFQKITQAYEIIKKHKKKEQYN